MSAYGVFLSMPLWAWAISQGDGRNMLVFSLHISLQDPTGISRCLREHALINSGGGGALLSSHRLLHSFIAFRLQRGCHVDSCHSAGDSRVRREPCRSPLVHYHPERHHDEGPSPWSQKPALLNGRFGNCKAGGSSPTRRQAFANLSSALRPSRVNEICVNFSVFHTVFDVKFW